MTKDIAAVEKSAPTGRASSDFLQLKCACGNHTIAGGECGACERKHQSLQRATRNSARETRNPGGVPPVVNEVLRSPGQPLDATTRAFFEPRFGHDFSRVRVHTDAKAEESAQAMHARAYTVKSDLVFGGGQFAPSTIPGRRLLAHELTHVVQQSGTRALHSIQPSFDSGSPGTIAAELEADETAERISEGRLAGVIQSLATNQPLLQRDRLGTRVSHPAGSRSAFRRVTAEFDGREFVLSGDGTVLMRVAAQSGRPYSVRPADAAACGGSTSDSYLNNPLYVGISDNGPIPEGEYDFRATAMATFDFAERTQMMAGGSHTDPFGASLHGGDWGAGRVALRKIRVVRGRRGCGDTTTRSGFYLHGGVMPGSSGCIDIGNDGITNLVSHLMGYRSAVHVRVVYRHPAPTVGPIDRALGRFTYPTQRDPSIMDRVRSLFGGGEE
jgi:hypothetical protein